MDTEVEVITQSSGLTKVFQNSDTMNHQIVSESDETTASFTLAVSILTMVLIIFYVLRMCFKSRATMIRAYRLLRNEIVMVEQGPNTQQVVQPQQQPQPVQTQSLHGRPQESCSGIAQHSG